MCRYADYGPYKRHFACFSCRKAFKRLPFEDAPAGRTPPEEEFAPAPCPECGRPMADMGLDFKPPKQSAVEHWEVVEFLFAQGLAYHSCGCSGPGYRPSRWAEVPAFLEAQRSRSAGELLAAKFAARAG
ncbi:MAG TPA: hypothetical protein PKC45_13660 [Gemmatales bacterium]|nr:hypothetical protein [Gemmatales bacterium]